MSNSNPTVHCKRWTRQEDQVLIDQVRVFPQNLKKCFHIVAEQLGRTPTAVQAHWYAVTSKQPGNTCFFTASPKHVSKNRKNGMGVESNGHIWRRLMNLLRSIID